MSPGRRKYRKSARAESEAETRRRILDAVITLHGEVGPLQTSVKSIAERAGVQRLTVYRHFGDQRAIVAACSEDWRKRHPPPALESGESEDPRRRARRLLFSLYTYYREGQQILSNITRDAPKMPELQEEMSPFLDYLEAVVAEIERAWPRKSKWRRVTLWHAVQFSTWQSVAAVAGGDRAAVHLVFRWCDAV